MGAEESASKPGVIVQDFTNPEDVVRTIQGLHAAGFTAEQIRLASADEAALKAIEDQTEDLSHEGFFEQAREAIGDFVDRLRGHEKVESLGQVRGFQPEAAEGHILLSVDAGDKAELAHNVIMSGFEYTGAQHAFTGHHPYLDGSTGSGAGVATSLGTATGMTPGSGYEGNTGSTAGSSAGALGQFAPGADSPDANDDFPGHEKHRESSR
ncbi:MAG TPA: hypothetical protein PKA95_01905 [Thermomicrobiales bacterium]|nr:hypothetical protein [Thermomicrobiales bacterium]